MWKEIRKIKKEIKTSNKYKSYKETFKNRKFRFLVSKIFLIFSNYDILQLVKFEQQLIKNVNENTFIKLFNKMPITANWNTFGKFIYLIYQTSNYQYDKKKQNSNIFIKNPLLGNEKKRKYYNDWLNSLDFSELKTNLKVRKLLKLVF